MIVKGFVNVKKVKMKQIGVKVVAESNTSS